MTGFWFKALACGATGEKGAQPTRGLQIVPKMKICIVNQIFTQIPHHSNSSDRHHLGNRTQNTELKNAYSGIKLYPKPWYFGDVGLQRWEFH